MVRVLAACKMLLYGGFPTRFVQPSPDAVAVIAETFFMVYEQRNVRWATGQHMLGVYGSYVDHLMRM